MGTQRPDHDRPHLRTRKVFTRKVAGVPLWALFALAVAIPFLIGLLD